MLGAAIKQRPRDGLIISTKATFRYSDAANDVGSSRYHLIEAVGDVCSRFFNRAGQPVLFPGSERLIAVELDTLKSIPTVIAVAAGPNTRTV